MSARWARIWFGATAACVVAGVVLQLFLSAHNTNAFGGSPLNRALNIFAYFTIQSNVLVGVTCARLAVGPVPRSTAFAVARLTGLVAITVTGVVFHVALSRLLDLDTRAQVANQLQHTVVPAMAVVGWLVFGPRGLTSNPVAVATIAYPLVYVAFTTIRGPLSSNFYPYPFADVHRLGYGPVIVNAVWISLLLAALAIGADALDRRLPGRDGRAEPS